MKFALKNGAGGTRDEKENSFTRLKCNGQAHLLPGSSGNQRAAVCYMMYLLF